MQNTILSDDIATAQFACDLAECKGACCVVGDAGAPVSESEIPDIHKAYEFLKEKLHPRARNVAEQKGVIQQNCGEGHHISCRESGECVFVSRSAEGVAYCTIQKAYLEGRIDWEKPMSCHLYPIRLKRVGDLEYANFKYVESLCSSARCKGEREREYLSEFLKKPLIRRYSEDWFSEFENACKEIRIQNSEAV